MVNDLALPDPSRQQIRAFVLSAGTAVGLSPQTINTITNAILRGQDLYDTISPYLPDEETREAFINAISDAYERFTTPDEGYVNLINQQAREGTLGRPAGLARLAGETNDALQLRERAQQQLGNNQLRLPSTEQVFLGKLISQFSLNYTDG